MFIIWYYRSGDIMNICYGGSFNPPTLAHMEIVAKLRELFNPENIIIVPCGNNYNRKKLLDFKYRYDMLNLCMNNVIISDIEALSEHYMGSLDTLNKLSEKYNDLYFVMGADNLITIKSWIKYQELLNKYNFIIFKRDDIDIFEFINDNLYEYIDHFHIVDFNLDISSSEIREDLIKNKNKLEHSVYEYIISNKLYE